MSQAATEAPVRGAPPGPSGGTGLSRKIGPLPAWGWLLGAAAVGVGFIWWRNRQNASAAAAANTAADTGSATDTSTDDAASIATLQSEIQQLQGEKSTEPTTTSGGDGGASNGGRTRTITVNQKQTLAQLAKRRGWPAARLKAAEALNGLSASSELRRGQVLKLPA